MDYLYVIASDNEFKVGWSTTPRTRLRTLGTARKVYFAAVYRLPSGSGELVEGRVHDSLEGAKVYREWFSASLADIEETINCVAASLDVQIQKIRPVCYILLD